MQRLAAEKFSAARGWRSSQPGSLQPRSAPKLGDAQQKPVRAAAASPVLLAPRLRFRDILNHRLGVRLILPKTVSLLFDLIYIHNILW